MTEHIPFHLVFLLQIFLISFYFPRKIYGRMRFVINTYPPSTHPKLYARPIEYYERAQRNYRTMNGVIVGAGLLILAALFVNPHDSDLGNAIAMGYFFVQMAPVMLLELSSLKEFKLMRTARSRGTRKADLRSRQLFDFISPALAGLVALTYVAFVIFIVYVKQFDFPWFGGYINILGITLMNAFFASIVFWQMYGKRMNPHQSNKDRTRQTEIAVKTLAYTSIAATVFVIVSVTLSAIESRHLLPVFLSIYVQLIAAISFQGYRVDFRDFEVYRDDSVAV